MNELDLIVLTRDLPERGLRAGDVGTVVYVYEQDEALEVEFVSGAGATVAVETLKASDVRPLGEGEILHAREMAA